MNAILCVGGAGFVGSHLVDSLIQRGHQVVVIDNLSTGTIDNLGVFPTFYKEDITDPAAIKEIFNKHQFDYVFHLAAQINLRHSIKEPAFDAHTNIVGSLNIIENCIRTNVKKFIFSSTGGAIYSPAATLPWNEQSETNPQSPYGLAKATIERYLQLYPLPHTILRYSNVYGPRQHSKSEAGVVSIFIEKALKGEDLIIFGDGKQTRDFCFVNDVVEANLLAMGLEGIYNVSSNTQISVNSVAQMILGKTGGKSQIIHAEPVKGELLHTKLSSEKLITEGWGATCDMEAGIEKTIGYFQTIYEGEQEVL